MYNEFVIIKKEVCIMKVIKRDGHMVDYCPQKIEEAIESGTKKK